MWRRKKFIIINLLTVILMVGSIGGVALAQSKGDESEEPRTLIGRVSVILAKDGVNVSAEQLQDAFKKATGELRAEAKEKKLQALVNSGKVTQEEVDQLQAWLESKPDVPFRFGLKGGHKHWGIPRMRSLSK